MVVVKGTFSIRPDGTVEPATEQAPVCAAPVYWGAPGRSSLRYETDMILAKPGTDVIVNGHAYAPSGAPTRQVDVSLDVGPIHKHVRVIGDRVWRKGLTGLHASEPAPFVKLPIRYERAFGGFDDSADVPQVERRNPVGVGFTVDPRHLEGQALPNVELPGSPIQSSRDRPPPVGLGVLAAHWSPRIELAGTYDAEWRREQFPLVPLDFDVRHNYCAPEDQRVLDFLREGSRVRTRNLTPEGGLDFVLPSVRPTFRTSIGGHAIRHHARLHTVIIEPDEPRVLLVWHTALPVQGQEHRLEKTFVDVKRYVGGRGE